MAAPKNTERKPAPNLLSEKRAKTLAALAATAQMQQEEKANNYEASKAATSTNASISDTKSLVRALSAPNEAPQTNQVVKISIPPTTVPTPAKKKGLGKRRTAQFGDPHIPPHLPHHDQSLSTYDNPLINALGNKPNVNTQKSVDMTYSGQLGN